MSTNSWIMREVAPDLFCGVYCHWNGGLAGVGVVLLRHYDTMSKVTKLIAGGDLSDIGTTPAASQYYARDRGENAERVAPRWGTLYQMRNHCPVNVEYFYIWNGIEWYVESEEIRTMPLAIALSRDLEAGDELDQVASCPIP